MNQKAKTHVVIRTMMLLLSFVTACHANALPQENNDKTINARLYQEMHAAKKRKQKKIAIAVGTGVVLVGLAAGAYYMHNKQPKKVSPRVTSMVDAVLKDPTVTPAQKKIAEQIKQHPNATTLQHAVAIITAYRNQQQQSALPEEDDGEGMLNTQERELLKLI